VEIDLKDDISYSCASYWDVRKRFLSHNKVWWETRFSCITTTGNAIEYLQMPANPWRKSRLKLSLIAPLSQVF
jgi:hypothetical protein